MNVRVGTSGYNFPEWKGTFYPVKTPESKMLEYYAQRLSTVEINYTFYRMPNPKTVAGWDAATPAGFTFVLKAPQRITTSPGSGTWTTRYAISSRRVVNWALSSGPSCFSCRPISRRPRPAERSAHAVPGGPAVRVGVPARVVVRGRRVRGVAGRERRVVRRGYEEKHTPLVATADFATCGCATKATRRRISSSGPRR